MANHPISGRRTQMSEPAISLRGVVKRYGAIVAVDGLDLEVPAGVCFGLLGPERRRQVDDDADAHGTGARRRGRDLGARL